MDASRSNSSRHLWPQVNKCNATNRLQLSCLRSNTWTYSHSAATGPLVGVCQHHSHSHSQAICMSVKILPSIKAWPPLSFQKLCLCVIIFYLSFLIQPKHYQYIKDVSILCLFLVLKSVFYNITSLFCIHWDLVNILTQRSLLNTNSLYISLICGV